MNNFGKKFCARFSGNTHLFSFIARTIIAVWRRRAARLTVMRLNGTSNLFIYCSTDGRTDGRTLGVTSNLGHESRDRNEPNPSARTPLIASIRTAILCPTPQLAFIVAALLLPFPFPEQPSIPSLLSSDASKGEEKGKKKKGGGREKHPRRLPLSNRIIVYFILVFVCLFFWEPRE